jgi:predicted RNase H-like nuclease (RuvC/YqgF family)
MKQIFLILIFTIVGTTFSVRAQDTAAFEERIKRLNGYIQDLQEKTENQQKQIAELGREVTALREKLQNQPTTATASQDDLRELTKKVQEIEEKRKADRAFLEKEFDKLAKLANKPVVSRPPTNDREETPPTNLPKDALEHTIASGDTLMTIAAAYSKETGRKITVDLILKANPGLKPERMATGKKILIPLPEK